MGKGKLDEDYYKSLIRRELYAWQSEMQEQPQLFETVRQQTQKKLNALLPDRVHEVITNAIREMIIKLSDGALLFNPKQKETQSLQELEKRIKTRIEFYSGSAAAEGAITGAGGFLMGLADFPAWLTIKMKMLHEIASIYGYDVNHYTERLYLLHIFQLAFSGQSHRKEVFEVMDEWPEMERHLPEDPTQFDWRSLQQQYRDFIDLPKLLQLIPGFGAAVGAVVNQRYTKRLGEFAMNAYRMRLEQEGKL